MERLTDYEDCEGYKVAVSKYDKSDKYGLQKWIYDAAQKLSYYEDAEEERRLLILPCAPGTTVYKLDLKDDEVLEEYVGGISRILELDGHFGDTVFFTRKEAKKRLKELENN